MAAIAASKLQRAVSRQGRRYSQVSLELRGDRPYLVLGVFEDGKPTEGSGSNLLPCVPRRMMGWMRF